jgi:hypothetical protein
MLDTPQQQTEPPTAPSEVFSSHPALQRQQMIDWSLEFFSPPTLTLPSRMEILEQWATPFQGDRATHRALDDSVDSSTRLNLNKRHFDITSVGGPKVKEANLEWMLQHVFNYPRNHNTNETAKEAARKYIVDSLQLTSGLLTHLQHFSPLQFLNIVSVVNYGTTVTHYTN